MAWRRWEPGVKSAALGVGAILAALAVTGGPARAADPYIPDAVFEDCGGKADAQTRVAACTRTLAIQGRWTVYYGWGFGMRAAAYFQLGDWEHAALDAQSSVDLAPGRPWGYLVRGALAVRARRFHKAIADLSQAIRLDKTNPWAFQLRGEAYDAAGDAARAIADYEQALKLRGK